LNAGRLRRTLLLLLLSACSDDAQPDGSTDDIIHGEPDTKHAAVVALIGKRLCSGTIVAKDVEKKIGWVVTAAHCVTTDTPTVAMLGADYVASSATRFEIVDFEAHPGFVAQGNVNDFAVVRIRGVDAKTPVIKLAREPDNLTAGAEVTNVGFGRDTVAAASDPSMLNTKRQEIRQTIEDVTPEFIRFDMRKQGLCNGDSGGPVIVGTGSAARVVGIHSYITGGCAGEGYSSRVIASSEFFDAQIRVASTQKGAAAEEPVELPSEEEAPEETSEPPDETTTTTKRFGCSATTGAGSTGWITLLVLALVARRRVSASSCTSWRTDPNLRRHMTTGAPSAQAEAAVQEPPS
jgi:secreted trypsin-like serine protease